MDLLARFGGRGVPRPGGDLVANPALENPPGLQLLFDAPLDLDQDALTLALRAFHPDLATAQAELFVLPRSADTIEGAENSAEPGLLGLIGWGRHVIKLAGFDFPMPAEAVEASVRPAHFAPELKQVAFENVAHVLLYYAGYEQDPLERYVALAATAAALARFGVIVVANENARTSIPAAALLPHEEDENDMLTTLRTLPIPFLYGGFVKLEVEGEPGIWMRTYGNSMMDLPDLAYRANGHEEGAMVFEIFGDMLAYIRESGRGFAPGDTMQVGQNVHLRLREPTAAEWYLESESEMLVTERISPDEVNALPKPLDTPGHS